MEKYRIEYNYLSSDHNTKISIKKNIETSKDIKEFLSRSNKSSNELFITMNSIELIRLFERLEELENYINNKNNNLEYDKIIISKNIIEKRK